MEEKRDELRLGTLSQQDVIYCKDCAILILRHVRSPECWPPLIGRKYLSCPVLRRLSDGHVTLHATTPFTVLSYRLLIRQGKRKNLKR